MIAPVHRLKKDEIVWLGTHRCRHRHTYLEHYNCFIEENPTKSKIGFFDIETSNLAADFGIMLCYCIKEAGTDTIYHGVLKSNEARHETSPDKRIVSHCINDLLKFDLIYTFYGSKFDLPFLRTRAISLGIDFPVYGSVKHKDVYFIIKNKFRLHRNRLEVACNELLGESHKTHFDGNMWRRALQGNAEALSYILEHCKADVIDLENLTYKIINFAYPHTKSI